VLPTLCSVPNVTYSIWTA